MRSGSVSEPPTRGSRPVLGRLTLLLLAALSGAAGGRADAGEPGEPPAPQGLAPPDLAAAPPNGDDTFQYLQPRPPARLRATTWVGTYVGLQLTSYLLTSRPSGPVYSSTYGPWDKLGRGATSIDSNTFRTNFAGHPAMGAALYQLARGNRLTTWGSALAAAAGSTAWELIEFHERASINDLVITPVAGVALGEPLLQLAAHLDRSSASSGRTALAWLAAPWKKLADALDGATLARGRPADTLAGRVELGAASASGPDGRRGEVRAALGWALWRDPDYGAPGEARHAWLDAQASRLQLSGAVGAQGFTDAHLSSSVLLAALYARAIDADGRGVDLVAGGGLGFEVGGHAWTRLGSFDLKGAVELPRLSLQVRRLAGPLRLTARLDAALRFGGSRSFALDGVPDAAGSATLPTVQRQFGYHFGLGGSLHPALELGWGPAALQLAWRGELLGGLRGPDPVDGHRPVARLDEGWTQANARASWTFSGWLEVALDAAQRRRWSRADATTRTAVERSLGLAVSILP